MPTGWVVVVANGVEFEALGQLREALLKQKDLQVTDVSLTGGSAQVRAKTALSADKVGELVAGAAVGTGIAKVSRISAGRVELAVVPKP